MSTTTSLLRFLSTPSARRATGADFYLNLPVRISIHALREEGDLVAEPRGWRFVISIHALREEGDRMDQPITRAEHISIHALCEEGDVDRADVPEGVVISIHALCEEGDSALL